MTHDKYRFARNADRRTKLPGDKSCASEIRVAEARREIARLASYPTPPNDARPNCQDSRGGKRGCAPTRVGWP